METISLKTARPLFLTKENMPRKECLMTIGEMCDLLDKPLSGDTVERSYQMRIAYSVMAALKKFFRMHHILFIAPEIEGEVHYGFSNDQAVQENYITSVHNRALALRRIENDVKMMSTGQLELIPIERE